MTDKIKVRVTAELEAVDYLLPNEALTPEYLARQDALTAETLETKLRYHFSGADEVTHFHVNVKHEAA